jgi:hypothetical protein
VLAGVTRASSIAATAAEINEGMVNATIRRDVLGMTHMSASVHLIACSFRGIGSIDGLDTGKRDLATHEGAREKVIVPGSFAHVVEIDVALRIARESPPSALLVQRLETQFIAGILVARRRIHDVLLLIVRSFSVRPGYRTAMSVPSVELVN